MRCGQAVEDARHVLICLHGGVEHWHTQFFSQLVTFTPARYSPYPQSPLHQINHLLSNFRLQVDLIPHENNCNVVALCFQFFLPPWSLKKKEIQLDEQPGEVVERFPVSRGEDHNAGFGAPDKLKKPPPCNQSPKSNTVNTLYCAAHKIPPVIGPGNRVKLLLAGSVPYHHSHLIPSHP